MNLPLRDRGAKLAFSVASVSVVGEEGGPSSAVGTLSYRGAMMMTDELHCGSPLSHLSLRADRGRCRTEERANTVLGNHRLHRFFLSKYFYPIYVWLR